VPALPSIIQSKLLVAKANELFSALLMMQLIEK
jgi:hypothetical protein